VGESVGTAASTDAIGVGLTAADGDADAGPDDPPYDQTAPPAMTTTRMARAMGARRERPREDQKAPSLAGSVEDGPAGGVSDLLCSTLVASSSGIVLLTVLRRQA
jgi:hypothetical protein